MKSREKKGIWEARPSPPGSASRDLVQLGLAGAKVACEGVAVGEAGETGRRQALEESLCVSHGASTYSESLRCLQRSLSTVWM